MQLQDREITNLVEIGRDPFGRVFKGLWGGRCVAVRSAEAFEEDAMRHAADLNRLIRGVRHCALPTYFGVGIEKRSPFLVMDFIEGRDLDSMLGHGSAGPPINVLWCTQRLLGALAELHHAGMAHGCVTARNVLFGRSDVHLVDLTFVPPAREAAPKRYWAPEPVSLPRDPASRMKRDLYGLGVVLFELGTRTQFPGVFRAADLARTVLEPIASVVARLLAPDPADRYSHAREVLADLAIAMGEASAPMEKLTAVPAASRRDYDLLAALEEEFVRLSRPHVEAALRAQVADEVAVDVLGEAGAVLSSIAGRLAVADAALKAEIGELRKRLIEDVPIQPEYVEWRARQVGGLLASHWVALLRESVDEVNDGAPLGDYLLPWSLSYGSSPTNEQQRAEFSELVDQLVIDRDAVNAIFETLRKEAERSSMGFKLPGGLVLERRGGQLFAVRLSGS